MSLYHIREGLKDWIGQTKVGVEKELLMSHKWTEKALYRLLSGAEFALR